MAFEIPSISPEPSSAAIIEEQVHETTLFNVETAVLGVDTSQNVEPPTQNVFSNMIFLRRSILLTKQVSNLLIYQLYQIELQIKQKHSQLLLNLNELKRQYNLKISHHSQFEFRW